MSIKLPCMFTVMCMFALSLTACQMLDFANLMTKPGAVLFQDDFSNPASGWTRLVSPVGIMDYDGGGYRFLVNAIDHNYWSTPGKEFQDVRIEVDSAKLAGPDENRLGVVCRYQDAQNYYFFVISSDGYYAIGKVKGGQTSLLGQEQMQYSEAIVRRGAVNHLTVECVGSTLRFFVNGMPVALVQDADFLSGDVGLLAGTFDQAGVDVLFDDFMVTKP